MRKPTNTNVPKVYKEEPKELDISGVFDKEGFLQRLPSSNLKLIVEQRGKKPLTLDGEMAIKNYLNSLTDLQFQVVIRTTKFYYEFLDGVGFGTLVPFYSTGTIQRKSFYKNAGLQSTASALNKRYLGIIKISNLKDDKNNGN